MRWGTRAPHCATREVSRPCGCGMLGPLGQWLQRLWGAWCRVSLVCQAMARLSLLKARAGVTATLVRPAQAKSLAKPFDASSSSAPVYHRNQDVGLL